MTGSPSAPARSVQDASCVARRSNGSAAASVAVLVLGALRQDAVDRDDLHRRVDELQLDRRRLLFVSGKTGAPELWELDNDHAAVQRTDRSRDPVPFPTGPSAPIWDRNTIAFEDNEGVRIVSVDPPRLLRTVPGTLPLLSTRSRAFVVQDPAGLGPRWVSFEATEVVR